MSVVFRFEGFDRVFEDSQNDKCVVNDHDGSNIEVKEYIDRLVIRNFVDDNLSFVPTCACGDLKGNLYLGDTCDTCGTKVNSTIDEELTFLTWLRQPEGVARLISPFMMNILMHRYKSTSPAVPLVQYICDTSYRVTGKNKHNRTKLDKLDFMMKNRGLKRGYNNFVNNFFEFIEMLEDNFSSNTNKRNRLKFKNWIQENKPLIFSGYLPIVNRSLFVFDGNETGVYIDKHMLGSLGAVRRFTGIDILDYNDTQKQNKTAKTICDLATFYEGYIKANFYTKVGLLRKHTSRTRSHFTARGVITSIKRPHQLDEIDMPWTMACSLYKPLILKGLERHGMGIKETLDYFYEHLNKYSPIIDEIFQKIIAGTKEGLIHLLNRNPTLHRGSIVRVRVTKIKTNVRDKTIGMSYMLCKAFNADYDGDQMNLIWLTTKEMIEESEAYRIHHNVMSLVGPNRITNVCGFPKTITSTIANMVANK